MESLNALIQGMGLMHLQAGQAAMLLVSLLLLWLATVSYTHLDVYKRQLFITPLLRSSK
ncbi:hypothetical protein AZ035_003993, partial [Klebsiella aerogenes]